MLLRPSALHLDLRSYTLPTCFIPCFIPRFIPFPLLFHRCFMPVSYVSFCLKTGMFHTTLHCFIPVSYLFHTCFIPCFMPCFIPCFIPCLLRLSPERWPMPGFSQTGKQYCTMWRHMVYTKRREAWSSCVSCIRARTV